LIDEPALDPAATQEEVTFTTESNVTFGLLTGHDMFFHSPTQTMLNKGIKYFIFNGAWKNKMPFQFCKFKFNNVSSKCLCAFASKKAKLNLLIFHSSYSLTRVPISTQFY